LSMPPERKTLAKEIEGVLCKDRAYLKRQLNRLPSTDHNDFNSQYAQIKNRLKKSKEQVTARIESIPSIDYPAELPITSKKDDICAAILENQVVVITGETGSGKTTQIPKMCLEAGRGIFGKIVCTQPRRIAAISLCSQVAKEMKTEVGDKVGYKIRFSDKSRHSTLIQFVTDGILLAEIQSDRNLSAYDTIIIDEAHERTLNIDFLLGYLKQLLLERPELKLIVTSATIDVEKFSAAFPQSYQPQNQQFALSNPHTSQASQEKQGAPIITVSGRMYPVEVRNLPIDELKEESGEQTMIDLVQEAAEDILTETDKGDILVFMSGVQEIREARDRFMYLEKEGFDILPLFGRLTNSEQSRIFKKSFRRKIILSTNIAETSITIPGIHYVIDTGRARVSQYNTRSGTQGLPIKAISQSSADQRKGRCGRISNGICIRLYSDEDYQNRPRYTVPEIQRSNLSDVILRLLELKLGDIETFPFIDPPESAQIRSGFRTLQELGALNEKKRLTTIGREMASLPIDPRTSRMVLQGKYEGTLYPVLIIASAISCQDPRERPEDKKTQAEQKHARFKSSESDLMTLLNLWEEYHTNLEELKTQNKMRKFCKANFLSYNKMREWRDIHTQLTRIARDKKWKFNKPDNFDYDRIHRSILAGYLPHIARFKEKKTYQGTRNRQMILFPGSDQYKNKHQWIVAIELIETSKLFAHRIARIDPDWLESLAGNLCKKSWSEPSWDSKSQRVIALEKVTLFGFSLVENRQVFYGKIDREAANLVFIREALIEEKFESSLPFWKHNQNLIESIRKEEAKTRNRNLLVEDAEIETFYLKRLTGIACLNDLKKLVKKNSGDRFLFMDKSDLLRREPSDNSTLFPTHLKIGEHHCRLDYLFEPGHQQDGITIHLTDSLAGSVREEPFEYLVPGLMNEKILWLLKNLTKEKRKKLVPIPDKAEKIWNEMISLRFSTGQGEAGEAFTTDFYKELSDTLFRVTKINITPEEWDRKNLPDFLRMNFALKKPGTKEIRYTRDLKSNKKSVSGAKSDWKLLIKPYERWEISSWDFGTLLEKISLTGKSDIDIWGYKTLAIKENQLFQTVLKNYNEAMESCLNAVPLLLEKELGDELAWLYHEMRFPPETLFRFRYLWDQVMDISSSGLRKKYESCKAKAQRDFHEQVQQKAFNMIRRGISNYDGTPVLTEKAFNNRLKTMKSQCQNLSTQTVGWIDQSLEIYHQVLKTIQKQRLRLTDPFYNRIKEELNFCFSANCLDEIPFEQWRHFPRIMKSYKKRIDRFLNDPSGEEKRCQIYKVYQDKAGFLSGEKMGTHQLWSFRKFCWMLEELKVSQYSQELSTAFPISPKRMDRFIEENLTWA
jgi:ATP-dependent RNA helicase HrpA